MAAGTLKTYRQRRQLKKTAPYEPYGSIKKKKSEQPLFAIQKHDASRLHYDFRLEIDGVLKSWAVPKGVPTQYGIKRLAIPTDDHPYDYAHFEGMIPQGKYGGGTVMVWDIGTYENIKEKNDAIVPIDSCYQQGTIEVFLEGKKTYGAFALIKTKPLYNKETWLLMKIKSPSWLHKKRISKKKVARDKSALTGRTMTQIARDHDAQWE